MRSQSRLFDGIGGMTVFLPNRLDEALDVLARHPAAHVLAGGTDFMVEVNFAQRRPDQVLALRRVEELKGWARDRDAVELGAGLTYTEMQDPDLGSLVPALAQAARTVGSPQIRNAGTLGGNLGTASPAGDTLPVLAALDARVEVRSTDRTRELRIDELLVGPKRHTLEADELITAVRVAPARGPQEFLKVGMRNAMVIAVCSVAVVVDSRERAVKCAIGSAGPTVLRARDAEAWVSTQVDWDGERFTGPPGLAQEFGRRVAAAAQPIDDHRSTADYRRHAVGVLAERALRRVS